MVTLGEKLKKLRFEKNITQKQIAEYLKIATNSYQSFEYGKLRPSLDTLTKLAEYFEVSTDYLLGLVDEPHHKNLRIKVDFRESFHSRVDALSDKSRKDLDEYLKLLETRERGD